MRIHGLDRLKFLAAITIVLLHTGAFGSLSLALNAILVNGPFRMAVPLFAILSGYFFASRDGTGKWFPWIRRIAVIYLGLMLVYLPFWMGQVHSVTSFVNTMIIGYFHLWYLPAIAVAAFVTHYGVAWRHFDRVVAGCAIIGLGLQYSDIYHSSMPPFLYRNGLFFLLPFFVIGYRLATRRPEIPGVVVVVALLAMLAESLLVYRTAPPGVSHDILLSLYFACPAAVAWCIGRYSRHDCAPNRIYGSSDFIYFYHVLAMIGFRKLGVSDGMVLAVLVIATTVALGTAYGGVRAYLRSTAQRTPRTAKPH